MSNWDPKTEQKRLETEIRQPRSGFSGVYMAVGQLEALFKDHPGIADAESVTALEALITNPRLTKRRQSYFLFRAAADLLAGMVRGRYGSNLSRPAMAALKRALNALSGPSHRASAEAMGRLPVAVHGPPTPDVGNPPIHTVDFDKFLESHGLTPTSGGVRRGRNRVFELRGSAEVLVIKNVGTAEDHRILAREPLWAKLLEARKSSGVRKSLYQLGLSRFSGRFEIPRPLTAKNRYIFRLKRPAQPDEPDDIAKRPVIAFTVHPDYFVYPNDPRPSERLSFDVFTEVIRRNARLMGELTGMGIVHTAPIPLFHNRVQQGRREDDGLYRWRHGGRLDQWLASSRYPNFGMSGLRDFEHLESMDGGGNALYEAIGVQFLSILLVIGSYFRFKAPNRIGFERDGSPVDVRHLFDPDRLSIVVTDMFLEFYRGFTDKEYGGVGFPTPKMLIAPLIPRMIEEMGTDRHMDEVLRVADQVEMTDEAFRAFLVQRGFSEADAAREVRGEREIALRTGPHLGGFNQQISLPEMIRFLETASALCVVGRFEREKADGDRSAGKDDVELVVTTESSGESSTES